ncbi:MAG: hypothetical protein O2944_07070 [Proteobacteria bacterium]|nr:hypothetical protein [Pseudomonadota bacterium]
MAKPTTRKSKRKPAGKPDGRSARDRLIDAALDLAQAGRWAAAGVADIAETAGVPLAEALSLLPSRARIIRAAVARVDQTVLATLADDPPDGSAKDRLFDLLMRRLDVLDGRRGAVRAILDDLRCDPLAALCLGPKLLQSMALTLEAAGISASGPLGRLRRKALGGIYLNTLRVWTRDDDPGLARTMAALDKGLRQAERIIALLEKCKPGKGLQD